MQPELSRLPTLGNKLHKRLEVTLRAMVEKIRVTYATMRGSPQ
jgi:hypothetical protein